MEVPKRLDITKEADMSVVTVTQVNSDFDKYQMEKNNLSLALIAGKFTSAMNIETDINIQIQNLVEVSVKSVCEKELRNKQNTIDELRLRVTELETTLEEKELAVNSSKEELRSMYVELTMFKALCEKKDQETADLKSALSQIQMEFAQYRKTTEESERRFISEKKAIRTAYEARISKLERELNDWRAQMKTISKTGKALEARFTSLSLEIKQEWAAWFLKFKENMPQDLQSIYEELRRRWEIEWSLEKTEEIRVQIEEEHTHKFQEMTMQIFKLTEKLKRLEVQSTYHSEVQKYTKILTGILKSERAITNKTSISYEETTAVCVTAVDNNTLEFVNTHDEDIDMTEWTIQNENHETIFFFPKRRLGRNEAIKVWTSQFNGSLEADELFTSHCEDWSKAGGLVICDAKGNVVSKLFTDDKNVLCN